MKTLFTKNFVYVTVAVITLLLTTNIIFTYYNNSIIERNQAIQEEVTTAKIYYDQIGKIIIHSLDIGLRGFAIIRNEQFSTPMDNARLWKDSILTNARNPLQRLGYDFTKRYDVFIDSLNSYEQYCFSLKQLLIDGKEADFKKGFETDRGKNLWQMYLLCDSDIQAYINQVDAEAKAEYQSALFNNLLVQVLLFISCIPTLIYTAIHTARNIQLSELLRKAEKDKNKALLGQNVMLEHKVVERTQELATRNEEISFQSHELAVQRDRLLFQNQKLQEAQETIAKQNEEIQAINRDLTELVNVRTQEVQEANRELVEQNTQLEQFAFIAAHNLRSPLARILGLTNVIKISNTEKDRQLAFEKLEESTRDLDHVIKDLTGILNIKKHTHNFSEVDLLHSFDRVKRLLETEIEETNTELNTDFTETKVYAVTAYVESILYNLISNAIKYRNPEHLPIIALRTTMENEYVCLIVTDNGLGIDLNRHRSNMFNLYRRFHLHMEGKGLGLFLVKTQIEALGGKIEVQSEPNKGTTFFVYFKRHFA